MGLRGHEMKRQPDCPAARQQRGPGARAGLRAFHPAARRALSALDKVCVGRWQEEVRACTRRPETTFVFVTHDNRSAGAFCRVAIFGITAGCSIGGPKEV